MKVLPALWSCLIVVAGCGARSHDPVDDSVPVASAAPSDDPPLAAEDPAPIDPDPVYVAPAEPSGACAPEAECCRNRDCEDGQVCRECPDCPGALACGWPLSEQCPSAELRSVAPLPNVMLLVDRSESMDQPLERTRKWDVVRDGLSAVLTEIHPDYRLGLTLFPAEHGNCGAPEVVFEPAEGQAEDILDALADREPLLATPLGDALSAMSDDEALADPSRPQVVVLVSDGGESCGRDPVRSVELLRDADPPIDLYVLPIDDAHGLADVARAADTGVSAWSSTPSALATALEDALDRAVPCRIELGELRDAPDPSLYDEDGKLVPHNPGGHEGWRLGSGGETLELHGATCRAWRGGAPLTIVWPCRS